MIEVLKQALEALEAVHIVGGTECVMTPNGEIYLQPAITSLRQAIAELESQVFGYITIEREVLERALKALWVTANPELEKAIFDIKQALALAHPPQRTWVDLTDKERFEIRMHSVQNMGGNFQETLCKAIEAKLKQKNGYAEEMNT